MRSLLVPDDGFYDQLPNKDCRMKWPCSFSSHHKAQLLWHAGSRTVYRRSLACLVLVQDPWRSLYQILYEPCIDWHAYDLVLDLCKKAQEPAGQGIMYIDVEIIIDWIPRREDGLRSRLAAWILVQCTGVSQHDIMHIIAGGVWLKQSHAAASKCKCASTALVLGEIGEQACGPFLYCHGLMIHRSRPN